jgi:hypothetical protein
VSTDPALLPEGTSVELPLQRRHLGRPFVSGWALVDQPPSLLQPGLDLIQVVENNGFRRSWSPQCPSIDLAVVADNEVMQHLLDFDGKSCHSGHVSLVGRMDYLVDTKVLFYALSPLQPPRGGRTFSPVPQNTWKKLEDRGA